MSRLFRQFGQSAAAAVPVETLEVVYPASGWLGDADEPTWEGTWSGTMVGSWHPVDGSSFPFFTQDDGTGRYVGVNPEPYEPSLSGQTGVEIRLAAGTQTPDDVGAATEAQWHAAGTGIVATHIGGGVVRYVGVFDAAAAAAAGPGAEWATRGAGTGAYGAVQLDAPGSARADIDWQSWCQIEVASLPGVACRVVGIRFRGDNLRFIVATGGVNGDPESASVRYQGVHGGGGSGWHNVYFEPSEVFDLGSSPPPVWLGVDGTAGGASGVYGSTSQSTGLETTGGNRIFRTGAANGVGTPIGATVPALNGGNFAFGLAVQLIIQVGPFYGSGGWKSNACVDPAQVPVPPNTVGMESVAPTFPFAFPQYPGLEMESLQLYFASHAAGVQNQMRVELFEAAGAMSLVDATGETIFHDLGPSTGTATGWVEMLSSPIDISTAGELRVSIKSASTGFGMSLGFTSGGYPNNVGRPGWPLAATVGDGELEYLAANGETWWDFQAANATASPLAPDSTPDTPGNAPGMHMRIGNASIQMTIP